MSDVRNRQNCVSGSILNAEKWVELTAVQAKRLDAVLRGYAGVTY